MLYDRRWSIRQVESYEELAEQLKDYCWCGCCGFELEGYLWLNDSTSPDRVQEYAVVRKPDRQSSDFLQVESITVGWCDKRELLDTIRWIHSRGTKPEVGNGSVVVTHSVADVYEALGEPKELKPIVVHPRIEAQAEHGHCDLCK